MSKVVAIDFETFFSRKLKYGLKQQIAEQYCRHNLFDCYMISASDGTTTWAGHPKDFNWASLDGKVIVSHNKYFDYNVWLELHRRGLCLLQPNFQAFHCTANLTAFLCNRRALDQACEYLFKVKLSKAARNNADGLHWPKDFSSAEQTEMLDYARRDAFYCWKLWNDFSDRWPEKERRLSNLTIEQGMRGVQIDTELLEKYLIQSHEMKCNTEKLLPWLDDTADDEWEGFNQKPTSTKCIAEQCRRSGIPCPPVKEHEGEEAYLEWEATYTKSHPWVSALTSWRSINKLYKTFMTVKERLRDDGTLPFALKYFGAHTGRWSGDAKVNMQNMRKKPVICNEHGLLETNDGRIDRALSGEESSDWIKYSLDFRALVIPRPGKKMIVSDLSQIEPRVLAWLSGDTAFLDLVRTGMSPYEAHARASMAWTGGSLKEENQTLYNLAKARILALGYGCGWEKFILMAQELAGINITAGDPEFVETENGPVSGYGTTSKKIVADYRAQNPKVVGLWAKLDEAFKRSIGGDFTMSLPSGRKMRYEGVRCEARIITDPETGKAKRKTVFKCGVGGRRVETYGGKLTENITQAVARDVFAEHLLKMEDNGWTNLFSAHDEAILEVDNDVMACDVERSMSECPDWLKGCPIAAKAEIVKRYKK